MLEISKFEISYAIQMTVTSIVLANIKKTYVLQISNSEFLF